MSSGDYYTILGVDRSSGVEELTKSYKELSLRWHAEKNPDDPSAADMFKDVSEAFDALRDPEKRAFYDKFGSDALKRSTSLFTITDCNELFKEFHGSANPFAPKYDAVAERQRKTGKDVVYELNHPLVKADPVEIAYCCTLEELYRGCTKVVKYSRQRYNQDATTTSEQTSEYTVNVSPGFPDGSTKTLAGEADEGPGMEPADVILKLVTEPHGRFRRDGDNLVYTAPVTLKQALLGVTIVLQTLDNRTLRIPINDIVRPGYENVVRGEGMPRTAGEAGAKGDLVIRFKTAFPATLTKKQIDTLSQCL